MSCVDRMDILVFTQFQTGKPTRMPAKTKIDSRPISFVQRFDAYIVIDIGERSDSAPRKKRKLSGGNAETFDVGSALKILEKGLGDRVQSMEKYGGTSADVVVIGLTLNPSTLSRLIDRGPPADSPEAASFRALWKKKSEMRKFADSSICETVVWSAKNVMERRRVIDQIAKYLLEEHFEISPDLVRLTHNVVDTVLVPRSKSTSNLRATGEEQFRALCEAYDKLSGILRSLDGLPLSLTRVQPISPSLRHTEIFPPSPCAKKVSKACVYVRGDCLVPQMNGSSAPPWVPSHEVHITLEISSGWPEDIKAIRQLKCAFYLKLRELLRQQFHLASQAFEDHLLVLMDAFIFRLVIVYPREATLLKMKMDDRGVLVMRNNKESTAFELATTHSAQHAAHMAGILNQHATFPLTCRLARRWICCHMLSDFVLPEAIELLVASLYLDYATFGSPPGSAFTGFLRFLRLLTTHDWLSSPLVVNLNEELEDERRVDIQAKFASLRPTLPPMCIVTPTDHAGSRWTRQQPIAMILERLCDLAAASADILEASAFRLTPNIVQAIFQPALHVYDVLIRLRSDKVPKRWLSLDDSEVVQKHHKRHSRSNGELGDRFPVVDFDPVAYFLRSVRETYDRYALFFYDSCGGDVIGVLWRPKIIAAEAQEESKSNPVEATQSTRSMPKISDMINDFSIIGKGLVKEVLRLKQE